MSWTMQGAEIKHTGCDVGYRPKVWRCDPCAHASKRYEVDGAEYPWFAIIDPLDDDSAIATKIRAWLEVGEVASRIGELTARLRSLGAR